MNSNSQSFAEFIFFLPNGQIGAEVSDQVKIFTTDGEIVLSLEYDFGRNGTEIDSDFLKNHYTGVTWENVPVGMTYQGSLEEYWIFYIKSPFFPEFYNERNPSDTGSKVHVATFNKEGKQMEDFPLENFYYEAFSKGSYIPISYIFSRGNNKVLLYTIYNNFTIVDPKNKTAMTDLKIGEVADLLSESPKILEDGQDNYKLAQDPCPLNLTRLETGEITMTSKENPEVILETIPAGYDPAFYSFNSDGSCNVVFTVKDKDKSQ